MSTSFEDIDFNSFEPPKKESDFIKLPDGKTQFRIISNPKHFTEVWIDNGTSKKRFTLDEKNKALIKYLTEAGHQCRTKHIMAILLRKENVCKILEFTSSIYSAIKELSQDEDWGKPSTYDITLIRNSKLSPKDMYRVMPSKKIALTDEQKKLAQEFNDRINFDKMKKPNDLKEIFDHMGERIPQHLTKQASSGDDFQFEFES